MSYIKPSEYKVISDYLGDAFAQIRDAINDADSSADAHNKVQEALKDVAESTDNDSRVSTTIDPVGSIMSDLGKTWRSGADNFSTTRASTTAANLFSSMLNKLNSHVKDRTLDPDRSPAGVHRTIQDWYETYAFISGDADNSLFSTDGVTITGYFSENFVDLSTALNITIPVAYRA